MRGQSSQSDGQKGCVGPPLSGSLTLPNTLTQAALRPNPLVFRTSVIPIVQPRMSLENKPTNLESYKATKPCCCACVHVGTYTLVV